MTGNNELWAPVLYPGANPCETDCLVHCHFPVKRGKRVAGCAVGTSAGYADGRCENHSSDPVAAERRLVRRQKRARSRESEARHAVPFGIPSLLRLTYAQALAIRLVASELKTLASSEGAA